MRAHLTCLTGAVAFATSMSLPAAASPSALDNLLNAEAALTQPATQRSSAWAMRAQQQVQWLRALEANTPRDSALHNKARLLLSLADLQLHSDGVVDLGLPPAVSVYRDDPAIGNDCAAAMELSEGESQLTELAADQSLWFRVRANRGEHLLLTTRGSTVDARLSVWADCRDIGESPLVFEDDAFGLQADAALQQTDRSFWLARIDNAGGRPGLVRLTALASSIVTGKVQTEKNTGVDGHKVAAFLHTGGKQQLLSLTSGDSKGRYQIALPLAGGYSFRTLHSAQSPAGLIDHSADGSPCSAPLQQWRADCGKRGAGADVTNLSVGQLHAKNFVLGSGPVLRGRVLSRSGAPIANAWVKSERTDSTFTHRASTDAEGRYEITYFSPASYLAMAGADGYRPVRFDDVPCGSLYDQCNIAAGTPFPLAAGTVRTMDFTLDRVPAIRINLTVDGAPLPEQPGFAWVEMVDLTGQSVTQSFRTWQGSSVLVAPQAPGAFHLRVRSLETFASLHSGGVCASDCLAEIPSTEPLQFDANGQDREINIDLRAYPTIFGRVISDVDGEPLSAGLRLQLLEEPYDYITNTDASGHYRFERVPPGSYTLDARARGYRSEVYNNVPCELGDPRTNCPGRELIVVDTDSSDIPIDFRLAQAPRIEGVIHQDTSYLYSPRLFRVAPSGEVEAIVYLGFPTQTTGMYSTTHFYAGDFRVAMRADITIPVLYPGVDCTSQWSTGSFAECALGEAQVLSLRDGQTLSGIDFRARTYNSLPVQVLSAESDEPLPGVSVDLWLPDGTLHDTRTTNLSGMAYPMWLLRQADPVDVVKLSTSNDQGRVDQVWENQACPNGPANLGTCSLTEATPIVLAPSSHETVRTFRLERGPGIFNSGFEP